MASAFAAFSVSTTQLARPVPFDIGIPVLVSTNDMSDCLIVTVQRSSTAFIIGRMGHSDHLAEGFSVELSGSATVRQILLRGESLYIVVTAGPASTLLVSEVTL